MSVVAIVRDLGPQFSDRDDAAVLRYQGYAEGMLDFSGFGDQTLMATALYTMHLMEIARRDGSPNHQTSVKEGQTAITFAVAAGSNSGSTDLRLTSYGMQLRNLMRVYGGGFTTGQTGGVGH